MARSLSLPRDAVANADWGITESGRKRTVNRIATFLQRAKGRDRSHMVVEKTLAPANVDQCTNPLRGRVAWGDVA